MKMTHLNCSFVRRKSDGLTIKIPKKFLVKLMICSFYRISRLLHRIYLLGKGQITLSRDEIANKKINELYFDHYKEQSKQSLEVALLYFFSNQQILSSSFTHCQWMSMLGIVLRHTSLSNPDSTSDLLFL